MEEKTKKLFEFLKENPQLLPQDYAKNLKVLSSRFRMFVGNFSEIMKSKYKISKVCDKI